MQANPNNDDNRRSNTLNSPIAFDDRSPLINNISFNVRKKERQLSRDKSKKSTRLLANTNTVDYKKDDTGSKKDIRSQLKEELKIE